MGYFKKRRLAIALVVSVSLAACSSQPRYEGKSIEQSLTQHTNWQYTQDNAQQVSYLTDLVSIDGLQTLINKAITNNPSLNEIQVTLKLALAQRKVAMSSQWFTLDADLNTTRNEADGTQYSSELSVGWELDVWQKIADSVSAQDMTIAASKADYQSAKDTLVASVIRSYLHIILQQDLLTIEQQRLTVLQNNEQSIIERYQYGLDDLEALDTARTNTASTQATIANYEEQIAQAQRDLVLLVGGDSVSDLPQGTALPNVLTPLASMPEQDLARRPDLQSAYYAIEAKRYLVDVAYKDLLPTLSLSATLSDIAQTPSEALLTSPVWSLLGNLSAPLFQGGALRAQVDIAKLDAEQAFWHYQDTLLSAVNEVENALGQEHALILQKQHVSKALASAKRSVSNYQSKYQQGLVDILDLLTVQAQVYDLHAQLSQLNYTLLTNRIDLGLALGLGVSS